MISGRQYNKEYFENGLIAGTSCYLNYRWLPELTIKMAHNIIKYLNLEEKDSILDFGCAKGYLVKALKILDMDAYGCDISTYAINNADADVREFCELITEDDKLIPFNFCFDWIITKDVLEHLNNTALEKLLTQASQKTNKCFHIVPLGDKGGKFIVPDYEMDTTHKMAKTKDWWIKKFNKFGWKTTRFDYRVKGIKDNWTSKYSKGNGFFVLRKKTP